MLKKLTDDDFYNNYKFKKVVSEVFLDENEKGRLETYGKDYDKAVKYHNKSQLWSLLELKKGYAIKAGLFNDAIYFMVTTKPYQSDKETYYLDL